MASPSRRVDVPHAQSRTYTRMHRKTFVALATAAGLVRPRSVAAASAASDPEPSFDAAVRAIDAAIARDRADPLVAETGLPRFYHHGRRVEHSVVLLHGFTTCPLQFDELAQGLHARGCNVYVPRIPMHGYADRLTHALDGLDGTILAAAATGAYRLTRGLGAKVSAVGLSLGGSMALYLAQTQPIDHAVPIAPFLMPIGIPGWAGMPLLSAVSWFPDIYVWWDPRAGKDGVPLYAYPGFPTHALAQCIFFANTIVQSHARPLAQRCTLVTNASETAVNNALAAQVIDRWNAAGAGYDRVVLDDLGEPRHDIIDPTTFPAARTLVYPRLEAIVLGTQ
jgi:carboxylesterase